MTTVALGSDDCAACFRRRNGLTGGKSRDCYRSQHFVYGHFSEPPYRFIIRKVIVRRQTTFHYFLRD
jgi:hypothetical protein